MIMSCLSAPFRLLGLLVVAGAIYIGWINRDELRRLVHRMTAEGPPPADEAVSPAILRSRASARLDSLASRRADSIMLTPGEITALVTAEVHRRFGGSGAEAAQAVDSLTVELGDGDVAVRGVVDASRLPKPTLGPVSDWINGRQSVEVRGPLSLLRVGTGQWRIDRVTVRGIPLPQPLWQPLISSVMPGSSGTITFPVDEWITGLRVTRTGAILYGRPR
jgi:hypothetical protein